VRGKALSGRRRPRAWALSGAAATLFATTLLGVPAAPAQADTTPLPGTMTTATQAESEFAVRVPTGVEVRAVNGVVTQPEVVEGGTITFRVNGAVRKTVPSALYQKVRIPVDQADVIADGTIGLTMSTEGPAAAGATCVPAGGVASMRKIELDYRGTETAPTTVADFFPPPSAAGVTVVVPENADDEMITAGLTAVAALAYRYDDDTPINLSLSVPPAEEATAGQRVVALAEGPPGDVTTAVSTTSGIPMLTLTGTGDALVDAARALSTDLLGLSGSEAQDLSQQTKPRSTARTRSLEDLGTDSLSLTGYGSVAQQLELRQDSFGVPVSSMVLHLKGSHTAFPDASGARLDVRANGDLVGSKTLGEEATFDLDAPIPAGSLRSVNDISLTLTAVAPDGSACTPPSIPAAEVDVDTSGSTVSVTHGTGQAKGFQLYPQIFEGTLPVALRSSEGRQASAAVNAAALVAELQRSAGSLLDIQLMEPDAFLADDRSGLMVGALSSDSETLDAPLRLSSTRLIDRADSTVDFTSQDPYAALESIDRNNRLVLMLGSWAPGDKAAPAELGRKVVDAVVNTGWPNLDGDLVIADDTNPAFVAATRSLAPHQPVKEEEKSWARWFVLAIAVLLLLLAFQVVVMVRRDRQLSRERGDEFEDEGPAYVEDDTGDDAPAEDSLAERRATDYEVDELGDLDDLQVHDYNVIGPADDDTGEIEAIKDTEDYDEEEGLDDPEEEWNDWEAWGDESGEVGPEQEQDEESAVQDESPEPDHAPEPDPEPAQEPEPEPDPEPEPGPAPEPVPEPSPRPVPVKKNTRPRRPRKG